MTLKLP